MKVFFDLIWYLDIPYRRGKAEKERSFGVKKEKPLNKKNRNITKFTPAENTDAIFEDSFGAEDDAEVGNVRMGWRI